jgi:hypothetical protein
MQNQGLALPPAYKARLPRTGMQRWCHALNAPHSSLPPPGRRRRRHAAAEQHHHVQAGQHVAPDSPAAGSPKRPAAKQHPDAEGEAPKRQRSSLGPSAAKRAGRGPGPSPLGGSWGGGERQTADQTAEVPAEALRQFIAEHKQQQEEQQQLQQQQQVSARRTMHDSMRVPKHHAGGRLQCFAQLLTKCGRPQSCYARLLVRPRPSAGASAAPRPQLLPQPKSL